MHISKEDLKKGILYLLIFVLLSVFSVAMGFFDLEAYRFLGKKKANIDREIFEENKSYVKGMTSDLADYRYQWQTADSETSKKAIEGLVRSNYADFGLENVSNADLRNWLDKVLNGRL